MQFRTAISLKERWQCENVGKIIIIGFVILNSISGLQITGISVNAVFIGFFTLFVGVEFFKYKNKGGMKIPRASGFLLFILCGMVSCLLSMAYNFRVEHYDIVKSYLINSTFYLVIFVLLFNCSNNYISECTDYYVSGIVWAARIQAIWRLYGEFFSWFYNMVQELISTKYFL